MSLNEEKLNKFKQELECKENFPNISNIFVNKSTESFDGNCSDFSIETISIVKPTDITTEEFHPQEEEEQDDVFVKYKDTSCQTTLSFPPDAILEFNVISIPPFSSPILLDESITPNLKRTFEMISPIGKNFEEETGNLDSPLFETPKKLEMSPPPKNLSKTPKKLKI
jgi:hypothetical protein